MNHTLPAAAMLRAFAACLLAACTASAPGGGAVSVRTLGLSVGTPGGYATIQEAVDAAKAGETIHIAAGTYTEVVTLVEGVHLEGADAETTVLAGKILASDLLDVSVRELTILATPGMKMSGIIAFDSGILVSDCIVKGWSQGADVTSASLDQVIRFERNTFRNNDVGIILTGGYGVEVYSNRFLFNSHSGVWVEGGLVDIAGNTLVANGTQEESGALFLMDISGQIRENIVVSGDHGVVCWDCDVVLDRNLVWGNGANYEQIAPGPDDISLNPRFVNSGELDFHLKPDSPCLDVGGTSGEPTTDFEGDPRPQGPGRDLGADEVAVATPAFQLTEVMANAASEASGEFVELRNVTDEPREAGGLVIGDGDKTDVLVAWAGSATVVEAGAYAVVLDPDYDDVYDIPPGTVLLTTSDKGIGNGLAINDPIRLHDAAGTALLDEWTTPFDPGNGISAELVSGPGGAVWRASPCSASPGQPPCEDAPAVGATLVITEIMANPTGGSSGEFVELVNAGDMDLEFVGYRLTDGDSTDVLAVTGGVTTLAPDQVVVVFDPDYAGGYDVDPSAMLATVETTTAIGNGLAKTDPVTLLAPDGTTVLSTYTHPVPAPTGTSVERILVPGPDASGNWALSTCEGGSSPGTVGCDGEGGAGDPLPTLSLTEVMANPLVEDTGEFLELYNFGESDVDVAGLVISDGDAWDVLSAWPGGSSVIPPKGLGLVLDPEYAGDYEIPETAVLLTVAETTHLGSGLAVTDPIKLLMADGVTIISTMLAPFNPGNGVSAERIDPLWADLPGNWAPSGCETGSSPGTIGCEEIEPPPPAPVTLVLTEVMASPLDPTTEEYVELFNTTDAPIDAGGLVLSDGEDADVLTGWAGGPAVVPPLGYALVLDSDFVPGEPTLFADDDFAGATLGAPWTEFQWPIDAAGGVGVAGGDLVLTPGSDETVGVVAGGAENFTVRTLSIRAHITVPGDTGPGDSQDDPEMVAVLQLGAKDSGDPSAMSAYAQLRYVAKGQNRNVELWVRDPGGEPVRVWGWQPAPWSGPPITKYLRLDLASDRVVVYHNDDDDLFHTHPHNMDLDAFGEAHALVLGRTYGAVASPADQQELRFHSVRVWRDTYDIPGDTVLLTTGDKTIGNGLTAADTLTLTAVDGETLIDSFSHPADAPVGVSVEKTLTDGGDVADNWVVAACGATPGRLSCSAPTTTISGWVDADYSESGHAWWRAIGYPHWFDPNDLVSSCELVTVCPGHAMTYLDNLAATQSFVFVNPYPDMAVVFTERTSPTDSCFEGCGAASFSVPAGETMTVPASTLGYYFVRTSKGLNGMDYDFTFYWSPPSDALFPPFQVIVGGE